MPPAVEAWSLNHWTAREVLKCLYTTNCDSPLRASIWDRAGQQTEGLVSVLQQLRCTCGEKARAKVAALSSGCRDACCPPSELRVYRDAVEEGWQDLELRLEGVGWSEFSQMERKEQVKWQARLTNSDACGDQAGDRGINNS